MAKELVIVAQPAICNLFLVNGSIRERLTQGTYLFCVAFATGYNCAMHGRFEFARLAYAVAGDASGLNWEFTSTREKLELETI